MVSKVCIIAFIDLSALVKTMHFKCKALAATHYFFDTEFTEDTEQDRY